MFSYFCYKKNVIKPITLYYDNTFFAYYFNVVIKPYTVISFPVAQLVEHGVSNAKIMGSIPRESKS